MTEALLSMGVLTPRQTAQLQQEIRRYPYFIAPRLALLSHQLQQGEATFDHSLRQCAALVPDRALLFKLMCRVENRWMPLYTQLQPQLPTPIHSKVDRTAALIDSFLSGFTALITPQPIEASYAPSIDYMQLLKDEPPLPSETEEGEKSMSLIDNFLEKTAHQQGFSLVAKNSAAPASDAEPSPYLADETFLTESLAKIYIKQGRYSKALEIIQKLSLKYPEKNIYFADQIRYLEKLIINTKIK